MIDEKPPEIEFKNDFERTENRKEYSDCII